MQRIRRWTVPNEMRGPEMGVADAERKILYFPNPRDVRAYCCSKDERAHREHDEEVQVSQ